MILAYARELREKGYDTSRNLWVYAWDIDVSATYMTYLQLANYDIPAVVVNGDTLTLKSSFVLCTPACYKFLELFEQGKLNLPVCAYCKQEIEGKAEKSQINPKFNLCTNCYSSEERLVIMKRIIDKERKNKNANRTIKSS